MGLDHSFKNFESTKKIQYPLVSYSKVKAFFTSPLLILFIGGGFQLYEGKSVIPVIFFAIVAYVAALIGCNLFGRKGGYLVGRIETYQERVDMHLLTPLGFGVGRVESIDMKEFASIHIKLDYEKGRLDDYELTLRGLHGINLPLCEVDHKSWKPEIAREIIEKLSADLKVPLENPEVLARRDNTRW